MNTCAVYGCPNGLTSNPNPEIQYYYFPKHPVIAQQWITACWRVDAIDINKAQVCSIHFDDNCYSNEYKLMDYLGHYSRILKYDAVPSLYLPNPHHQVIVKSTTDKQPITLNISNTITQGDIKNLVIYNVQDVTFDTNVSHQPTLIPITTDFLNIAVPIEASLLSDDCKFDNKQFQNLENENKALEQNITALEETIRSLEMQLSEKSKALTNKDNELTDIMREYDMLQRTHMTYDEQTNILSKVFSPSQLRILSGLKKIRWTNDDMAMGYTIRKLSNKRLYLYLTKHLNIPLPALSSIQRWASSKYLNEEIEHDQCEENDT